MKEKATVNVDTPQTTHISLCSGYGGIDLGLKRCIGGLRTVAYAEIEASAIELLLARMEGESLDPAPIWTDLKSFPWGAFSSKVDILSGGYPCQPFSSAGKRLGAEDPRHLWPSIAAGIRLLRPRLCFFENVEGHISLGLSSVISDLEEMGYKVSWGIFSAAICGAPHQRKRVFVLAVSSSIGGATGFSRSFAGNEGKSGVAYYGSNEAWPSRPSEPQHEWEPPRVVGDAKCAERGKISAGGDISDRDDAGREEETDRTGTASKLGNAASTRCQRSGRADDSGWHVQRSSEPDGGGSDREVESEQRQTQPALGGDADGVASWLDYGQLCVSCDNRTDELRLLGNGVVPATAALAFQTLWNELSSHPA